MYSLFQNMANDTVVPISIVELDELYKNIVLNLIEDQSITNQTKTLFELKVMNVIWCINYSYMNCNKELEVPLIYLYLLLAEQTLLTWSQCYGCFSRPTYIKVQKCALSAVALAIYINSKS